MYETRDSCIYESKQSAKLVDNLFYGKAELILYELIYLSSAANIEFVNNRFEQGFQFSDSLDFLYMQTVCEDP